MSPSDRAGAVPSRRVPARATGRQRAAAGLGSRSAGRDRPGAGAGTGRGGERGSATAELAAALPALVLLLLFALGAVDTVLQRVRCVDAARDAALAASRGEDGEAAGRRGAPNGATVSVQVEGATVRAQVSVPVRPLGPHLPGMVVGGEAVADVEPGAGP